MPTDFKKDADLSFAGGLGKLAYKDFLDSPEQRKTYIANVVLCNGVCYQDDTAIKTAQIQFNIVPKANGTMAVENLQYRKLDENSLNLYAPPTAPKIITHKQPSTEKAVLTCLLHLKC